MSVSVKKISQIMNQNIIGLIDLHTHHEASQEEGIISCNPWQMPGEDAFPGQRYSVGVHPWEVNGGVGLTAAEREVLEAAAKREDVVAIGECGLDLTHPGAAPLFQQMLVFKAHVELSEKLGKPMIIHCVKAHDQILGIRKDMGATQPWVIHGFRGKPSILQMLLKGGISVSYGEKFNPESLLATPLESIFAETDESPLSIHEIIARLAAIRSDITEDLIAANVKSLGNRV